ncbi:late competence development protein ComFB [Tamilnaduibacter salinus]|uniref:Late competence development protein ComFB n=1 Tax=Tamilnaduibacter salinus TaxID=1484056 RepID=A0A2A2I2T2_9GAMM|nr:late competence development ComFB family protein [Tamilnaduibacter salinus]PAV26331.1 hypothetical protein CF392_06360 [Tamilnaduibacter salinus]PVY79306.1 late competence development protein ComFB [Tamilnaduibacter salinus]
MSLRDGIDNFYERLVADEVDRQREPGDEPDFLEDVMCVSLNALPPRYYRHSIDMMFYLSAMEMAEMEERVSRAVTDAFAYVRGHTRSD